MKKVREDKYLGEQQVIKLNKLTDNSTVYLVEKFVRHFIIFTSDKPLGFPPVLPLDGIQVQQ